MIEAEIETLGVKVTGYNDRKIEECLNCTKYKCDGCPVDRREGDKAYYERRKARLEGDMVCPHCGGKTKVVDSRAMDNTVIRRRRCDKCGQNTYTEERMMEYVTGMQSMSDAFKASRSKTRKLS